MNWLKNLTICSIFLFCYSSLIAQKTADLNTAGNWHIRDVFYLNQSQGIGIAEFTPLRNFVVLVNNEAKVEWEARIDEYIWGISKFKGNILAFYKKFGELHMATLDPKSGRILDDKLIYKGSKQIYVTVQNDPSGNFGNVLIRSSFFDLKTLTLITLAENGNATIKEVPSVAIGASYIGNSMAKDGHFFIASIINNSVVVEQFNHEAVLESKLEKPLDSRKKFSYSGIMRTDNYNNNAVVISLKYQNPDKDYVFSYFNFDFEKKQVAIANEKPLNKESDYKFKSNNYLEPMIALFTNDRIILLKEVNYLSGSSSYSANPAAFFSGSAVVSVYDKQMHLLHDIVLEKDLSPNHFAPNVIGSGCHIINDKLYFLTNDPSSSIYYTIDINSGKWEKKKTGTNRQIVTPASTFWLNNECIVSHITGIYGDYKTKFEVINYSDL